MKFASPLAAVAVLGVLGSVRAEETKTRAITLDDCIRMALEKNLDIRIARVVPKVAALELGASYGDYYDPQFQFVARQSENKSPGQGFVNTFNLPPNQTWTENYSSQFTGYLPSGLNYTIQGGVGRNSSDTATINTNISPFPYYSPTQYTPNASVSIDQPLLKNFWIDRFRYQIELNKRTIQSNEQDLRSQAIATIASVADAYLDVTAAREKIAVQEKSLQLSQQQLAENKKRVEVGALAPLDEKQAESQVATARAALLNARSVYGTAQITLKQLITDDFASVAAVELDPQGKLEAAPNSFSRQDSWHKGLTLRPDVLKEKLTLESKNITVRFNRNQLFPQLDLTGSYGVTARRLSFSDGLGDVGDRTYPNFSIGVVFSMPLESKAARNRLKEVKLQAQQELLTYQKLEQKVMGDILNDIGVANSAFQRVEATKAARDYALLAYEAEKKKLENGKSTSFVVLQLQSTYITAAGDAIQAIADYNKALDALYKDEGSILDHMGVQFTYR